MSVHDKLLQLQDELPEDHYYIMDRERHGLDNFDDILSDGIEFLFNILTVSEEKRSCPTCKGIYDGIVITGIIKKNTFWGIESRSYQGISSCDCESDFCSKSEEWEWATFELSIGDDIIKYINVYKKEKTIHKASYVDDKWILNNE